ncbi:Quinone oxidoreductase-like protein 2 [Orchesella cincta]|uniref:Quinone oxidoreductase-like protein 2 n=1 Tax=Orchesella cincta TaxID=48709 RepID=A0A1D2N245_ORCCI|nr:Quinone oxidoreductase-like protein 2 [Orchesella cincta]
MGLLSKTFSRAALLFSTKELHYSHRLCKTISTLDVRLVAVRYASSYKAAVLREAGTPLVIEELERKPLKKGEVRIGIYCCGINSIDQWNVIGGEGNKTKLPLVPGYEICGEVLEVKEGDDSPGLKPGQRVIGMHPEFQGGFAEEIIISPKDLWPVNDSISFEIGATLVNSYATALIALCRRAEVKEGDSVLVTGAGGRLGLAAVDLAANVYRCKVIAFCNTNDKAEAVRAKGAFATIIQGQQDLVAEVKRANDGKGIKIIIDTIGGNVFKEAIKCLDDEAKIIVTGFASKNIPQIGADELMENSYSVIGVSLDQYRKKKYDVYRDSISEVIEMADEKLIKPYKAKHFKLDKVNEALEALKDPTTIGKFVIDIK